MAAPTIVWQHLTQQANENGIAWSYSATPHGSHAISGGGYAEAPIGDHATSTDVSGGAASSAAPVVASFADYDSGTDTTYWHVGFAAPPGAQLRTHVFAILAD